MEVKIERAHCETLTKFADRYGLKMQVRERDWRRHKDLAPWYAHFERCDIEDGIMAVGVTGNGSTAEAAQADYADRLNSGPSRFMLIRREIGKSPERVLMPWFTGI